MGVVLLTISFAFAVFLYFIPAIVAKKRGRKDYEAILVLNLFLGWTFIGWVVALVWAAKTDGKPSESEPFVTVTKNYYEPTKICPHCAETVKEAAKVCKHCHSALDTTPVAVSRAHDDQLVMSRYGITKDGDQYRFGAYRYDKLSDAINYAIRAN